MTDISIKVGDTVKWASGRKPIGKVVHIFTHRGKHYAVVENEIHVLKVVHIYDRLLVVQ